MATRSEAEAVHDEVELPGLQAGEFVHCAPAESITGSARGFSYAVLTSDFPYQTECIGRASVAK